MKSVLVLCLLLVAVQGIPLDLGFGGVYNDAQVEHFVNFSKQ